MNICFCLFVPNISIFTDSHSCYLDLRFVDLDLDLGALSDLDRRFLFFFFLSFSWSPFSCSFFAAASFALAIRF
jgi:hypothetical protein